MAFRSSTKLNGSSATLSVAVPSGAAINDIAIIKMEFADIRDMTGLLPSGFAVLNVSTGFGTWVGASAYCEAWKRLSAADSGSYTLSALDTSNMWVMTCELYSGRDTGNPPTCGTWGPSGGVSTGGSFTAAGVTALAGDDLSYGVGIDWNSSQADVTWTPSSGFTEAQSYSTASWAVLSTHYKQNVGAGATGSITATATWSGGTGSYGASLIRIPAAAAPTGNPWHYYRQMSN